MVIAKGLLITSAPLLSAVSCWTVHAFEHTLDVENVFGEQAEDSAHQRSTSHCDVVSFVPQVNHSDLHYASINILQVACNVTSSGF